VTKEEFVGQLERAAATMGRLPVSAALVGWLSEELKRRDPPWWGAVLKAWEKRKFVAWTEAWGLFLTSLHYEALSDAQNPLVPYFPSCGGTDEADPSGALAEFLRDAPKTFYEKLRTGYRRAYISARAPMWIGPALMHFQRRNLPFYLVEVNSGAGLNLAADRVVPRKGFDSELVAARIGLDPQPQQLEDISHRRWLTAAIMPDAVPLIAELDNAIETTLKFQGEDAAFIQLVECRPELAARFVGKNIPADDKEVGLLLFNMGVTVRMTDEEYEAYKNGISQMMLPWQDRALWVEVESVRGELYSTTYQVRAHRLLGGEIKSHVILSLDFSAQKTAFNADESAKFFA
jgi:hypothetical protein